MSAGETSANAANGLGDVAVADKCVVRDGNFVEACDTLRACTDNIAPGFSKAKGIARWSYTNWRTREPSRTFYGVKCTENPNGMAFNFCPFCGEKIDAPFNDESEAPTQEARHD